MATPKKNHGADVKVRMYRQGFGDCFLLTLPGAGERPFYLMIDCGLLFGSDQQEERMQQVVRDVHEATGGRLDLLVITHEHWDHVSGFLQARELFARSAERGKADKLHVDALWLGWTENPDDELARQLGTQRKKTERALGLAVQKLRDAELETDRSAASERVESVLGFFGAAGAGSTTAALEAARGYAHRPPRYLGPGEPPFELGAAPGVRFFVLGPPRDEKMLKKSHPSKTRPEVYDTAMGLDAESAFFAALSTDEAADFSDWQELSRPFDRDWRIPLAQARQLPFFKRHYWGEPDEVDYQNQAWRRIDSEWLRAAESFALKLDEDTNNTSLVLAIEIVKTGAVLLFPGDAQVGNWLSWESLVWTLPDGKKVTARDLLARTVLYKVGHHGSHNATLREKGLELMQHEKLVAMIPVSQPAAAKKGWRKIPFEPLLARLGEKTGGRVLRSDQPAPAALRQNVVATDLYFELDLG